MSNEQLALVSMREQHAGHALVVYQTEYTTFNVFDGVVDYENQADCEVESQTVYCRNCQREVEAIVEYEGDKSLIKYDDEEES